MLKKQLLAILSPFFNTANPSRPDISSIKVATARLSEVFIAKVAAAL